MSISNNIEAVNAVRSLVPSARRVAGGSSFDQFTNSGLIATSAYGAVPYADGSCWAAPHSRSLLRILHGMMFMRDWINESYSGYASSTSVAATVATVLRKWKEEYPHKDSGSKSAYHDETTGQRMLSVLGLLDQYQQDFRKEDLLFIREIVAYDASLVADPDFHSSGTNHGMFQDLALLCYANLQPLDDESLREEYIDLSFRRLQEYFSQTFTSEGVHRENSPSYHLMIAGYARKIHDIASSANREDSRLYKRLLHGAARYATHAITPTGQFPPVSDTATGKVATKSSIQIFDDPEFKFAYSEGKLGTKPTERRLLLEESGYAIYRSEWCDPKATYVFFSAAYNADYHKHSDDNSLFVQSNGTEIIREAGPHGYDYQDPFTIYGFSSFAHNVLVVDGEGLPRTDGKSDLVQMRTIRDDDRGFTVQGSTRRYSTASHERVLDVLEPPESIFKPKIRISDYIDASKNHEYEIFWHFGPNISPVITPGGIVLYESEEKVAELIFASMTALRFDLHRGQTEPRILGWYFPEMSRPQPTYTLSIGFTGKKISLHTRINLDDYEL